MSASMWPNAIRVWPYEAAPRDYRRVASVENGESSRTYIASVPASLTGARLRQLECWFAEAVTTALPAGELLYKGTLPQSVTTERRWLLSDGDVAEHPGSPISLFLYEDAPAAYRMHAPLPDASSRAQAFLAAVPAGYTGSAYQPLRDFLLGPADDLARVPLPDGDDLYVGVVPDDRSLYERLGGETSVAVVVERFYVRVLADDRLSAYFADVDMARQRRHLAAFIAAATGGPKTYTGRDLHDAHASLKVASEDFDQVVFHLVETLSELGVSMSLIADVAAALGPLKPLIVAEGGLAASA